MDGGGIGLEDKVLSAGKGALLLTVLGAVSQLLGFGYRVILSRMVGAEVMGLYQLVMPVYSVLMSLTAVGVTAAVSNLTARYLALGNGRGADQVVSTCLRIFFLLLLPVGAVVILCSDAISVHFLGDARTQLGLILLVPCVALTGVENIHKHFFYGSGRVKQPAAAELAEQVIRTAAVLGLLRLFLPQYPERVVGLIVTGMVACEIFSALTMRLMYRRRMGRLRETGPGERAGVRRGQVAAIAFPVGLNALLGNWMGAANSALIPQKLVEGGVERGEAVARLGVVCGMTLPMLALPTVFLGAMNLILVPRLARAHALNHPREVRRLASRALSAMSVLIFPSMAMLVVLGPDVGVLLFRQVGVGEFLLPLAAAMTMNCGCSIFAAILNGVERQREVAAVSLLGGGLQLSCTLALVPHWGMEGYVAGNLLSAAVELVLYLWLAVRRTGLRVESFRWLVAPGLSALLAGLTANLLVRYLKGLGWSVLPVCGAGLAFGVVMDLVALSAQGISLRETLRVRW